jgi:hypothetical protein
MAVPVAGDLLGADGIVASSLWPAAIARARKHRLELGSPPARERRIVGVSTPGDYATFNSNHTPDGTA